MRTCPFTHSDEVVLKQVSEDHTCFKTHEPLAVLSAYYNPEHQVLESANRQHPTFYYKGE